MKFSLKTRFNCQHLYVSKTNPLFFAINRLCEHKHTETVQMHFTHDSFWSLFTVKTKRKILLLKGLYSPVNLVSEVKWAEFAKFHEVLINSFKVIRDFIWPEHPTLSLNVLSQSLTTVIFECQ